MEINKIITVTSPALSPKMLIRNDNPSSGVDGIVSLILFFKLAQIHKIARYFIFALSVIVLLVALIGRFTDFVPTSFQILMYAFYQLGITVGIFLVTRRKESDLAEFS